MMGKGKLQFGVLLPLGWELPTRPLPTDLLPKSQILKLPGHGGRDSHSDLRTVA